MKNKTYVLIVSLLIGFFFVTAPAYAARACWQLSPFSDQIEMGYEGHSGHYLVHGKWVTSFYFLPITGNLSADGAGYNLGIHVTNGSVYFGDYDNCVIDARLDGSLTGPFTIDCGAGGFTNSGTLTPISCPIAAEFDAEGSVAGE